MSPNIDTAFLLFSAPPLTEGKTIEVRGSLKRTMKPSNPHPTLYLGKGEANLLRQNTT
jgi:hypothetical protein